MRKKQISLSILLLLSIFLLSACGKKQEAAPQAAVPFEVSAQTIAESRSVKQDYEYPGMIGAQSEAVIVAKTSGNLSDAKYKVGDKVSLGQELAKIDDVNSARFNPSNYNTNQIKQAKLAVSQAQTSYNLARSSYESLLVSSVKDLRSAEIARDQAAKGQSNLDITTNEGLKSAELAFETSKIAAEQARLALENREKLAAQSVTDTQKSARNTADAAYATAGGVITSINNVTGLDENNTVLIPYRTNLGALDSTSYQMAKSSYQAAKSAYDAFASLKPSSLQDRLDAVGQVVSLTKKLADDTRMLFEKTITSSNLPQTSATGVSLSGLQQAASGYQSQMTAAVSQIDGASQALANLGLNNDTLLDSLRQAYELAKQQQASAEQALNNLKAGNTSQKDQASYAYSLAQNQYDNLKVKLDAQVQAARSQMEAAGFQYNNAVTSLESLYDAHSVISPLNGTITKVNIANGEAVAAGQPVLTVSQTETLKVRFYAEPDNISDIKPGQAVTVITDGSREYPGLISSVSPQADPITRRFLVEVKLEQTEGLLLGTVATVKIKIEKQAGMTGLIILPLQAVSVGQSGSYVFVIENGVAKKMPVEVKEVMGELARIKLDLPENTFVITDGNRLLQEGQAVSPKQR